jgi:hypothetical protein
MKSRGGLVSVFKRDRFLIIGAGRVGGPPIPVYLREHYPKTELFLFVKVCADTSPVSSDIFFMVSIILPIEPLR